jgi:hypothetical protein
MNKSTVLQQLTLPKDIVDYICEFSFYTYDQSIERNRQKYNRVVYNIKKIKFDRISTWGPMRTWKINLVTIYIVLPISNQLIIYNICYSCGNYVKKSKCQQFTCKCY